MTGKGQALRTIKDTLCGWTWASHKNRAIETALARMRIGHVGVAQHLHRFQLADTPLCGCGAMENVKHFLLECPLTERLRISLRNTIGSLRIAQPVSLKLLLGGEHLPEATQFKIRDAVAKYILATGRLHSL